MAIIRGNQENNLLSGTAQNDYLDGGAGDDILRARLGDDALYGRIGQDRMFGDAGNDFLDGGDGSDYMDGGADNDTLRGSLGNDQMFGRDGNDNLYGGAGDDVMFGGLGDDVLRVGRGNEVMTGNMGNDVFRHDFQWRDGETPEEYVPNDNVTSTITDFVSGQDRLAITMQEITNGPDTNYQDTITLNEVLGFDALDTNDDMVVNGLDDYTTVDNQSITIDLDRSWQINPEYQASGSITLLDVVQLTAGDFVA